MTFTLPADASPIMGMVLDHWRSLHPAPHLLPGRQHFDPVDLAAKVPDALPHLWLMGVEESPRRYRLRLIGGALKRAGSPGNAGDYLDQVDRSGAATQRMDGVCAEARPSYRRGPPTLPHGPQVKEIEVLVLPLATDGRKVDMLLACTLYHWHEGMSPPASVWG